MWDPAAAASPPCSASWLGEVLSEVGSHDEYYLGSVSIAVLGGVVPFAWLT